MGRFNLHNVSSSILWYNAPWLVKIIIKKRKKRDKKQRRRKRRKAMKSILSYPGRFPVSVTITHLIARSFGLQLPSPIIGSCSYWSLLAWVAGTKRGGQGEGEKFPTTQASRTRRARPPHANKKHPLVPRENTRSPRNFLNRPGFHWIEVTKRLVNTVFRTFGLCEFQNLVALINSSKLSCS